MARVLVVEDEPDLLYSIQRGLTRNGFDVDAYGDPMEALAKFKPDTYNVLLIDIRMPKMNGFELYRAIKKSGDKSMVFFITAFEVYYQEFQKVFPDLDVKYFIKKPITIAELVAKINQAQKQ